MDPVTHFEIPADNVEDTKKFYQDTFGWEMKDWPELDYTMVMTGECDEKGMPTKMGVINGGMYKRGEEGATSPVLVIQVEDVDEALKKATANGGEVVIGSRPVGDFGIYAQFKDPQGNILGLWKHLKKE